jgi:hypothetical protein
MTKSKIRICAPNISELGQLTIAFEELVTYIRNSVANLFILNVACLVSNCVPEIGTEKHPDVWPQYAPIHFLRKFPLLQVVLEQPVLPFYFIHLQLSSV